MEAEIQALRAALANGGGQGQGAARGPQPNAGPDPNAPLANRLAQNGELDFLVDLLNTKEGEDPTLGVKRFAAGFAQIMGREIQQAVEADRQQHFGAFQQRQEQQQAVAQTFGAIRSLAQQFPELDENNTSPEAVEHQQAFIEIFQQFPPEMRKANPGLVARACALLTRDMHGTPVFATPPGTSGSPSAAAVMASAQALGQATPDTLSGTGTPRPRPSGQPESAEERIRRENAAVPGEFVSPSGKRLGFGPAL